jgi:hypothetical protein
LDRLKIAHYLQSDSNLGWFQRKIKEKKKEREKDFDE